MISSPVKKLKTVFPLLVLLAIAFMPFAGSDDALAQDSNGDRSPNPYLVETLVDEYERLIDKVIVPCRPPEIKALAASVPEPNPAMGINSISDMPVFNWSYGCSATAAAMLFGHYDNTGYSNMYAGPTNGGVCPMDNSIWGPGIAGSPGECPLSATHKGKDGRTTKGHVDDYWVSYASTVPDPFIGNWTEHSYGECTGDYMGTNQSSVGNVDGETTFYYYTDGDPLYDYDDCEPACRDGCHGLRLFAQSRGYAVVANFSQYIKGEGSDPNKGFTFADFQSEIDAGRPVLIQVQGHTMLGYGYNTSGQIVYIHDTWDRSSHSMTWGETYQGRQHYAVAVIQLQPVASSNPPNIPGSPSPENHSTGVPLDADLSWTGGDPDAGDTVTYDVYFGTSGSVTRVSDDQSACTYDPGTLNSNTEYSWKIVARDNHGAATVGPLWDFSTGPAPNNPPGMPSNPLPANQATDVAINADLSWTGGDPDPGDTVTYDVYFGTSASPPLVSIGQTGTTYDPGTLSYTTRHYWKIVARDNHEALTSGPLWDFSTQAPVGVATWNCPLGGQVLIAPNPGAGRPFLTVPAGCEAITASAGADLWGIYYLIETGPDAGRWLWYIPGFATSPVPQLEPGQYYCVIVSGPCTLIVPQ
jgi:YD repeat-containing protein